MTSRVSLVQDKKEIEQGTQTNMEEKPIELADLLVAYLEQLGIEYIFGMPGGAIEPLYNALARSSRRGGMRPILARHETSAAYMADGYARETGKIGVCCSTSGPGATNLITGVACAYDNGIPMLVITGQPSLPTFGKHALQESSCTGIDVLGMFNHCTHYNSLVSHPQQFESKLVAALQTAIRARGPAHLSLPLDICRSLSPVAAPSYDLRNLSNTTSLVDDDALRRLCQMLSEARKAVLLIGGSCGEAVGSIMQFAVLTGTPFVTSPDGKGLVNPRHPLFKGVFGFGGHAAADAALRDEEVDIILAVGTSMGELNTGGWSNNLLNSRLVHIDDSETHLLRTPMARLHIRGRILAVFDRLRLLIQDGQEQDAHDYARRCAEFAPSNVDAMVAEVDKFHSDATPIKPQRLMYELSKHFPPSTCFFADAGNSMSWGTHYLHPIDRRFGERRIASDRPHDAGRRKSHGGWFRITMNFAPMGWAIGAAVGVAMANPNVPVVCITGDGSILMNGQELSVAVAERQTVIFVVLNDSALGMVKHGQRLAGSERVACDLPPTDFAAIARAMGADGYTIRSPEDFAKLDVAAMCTRKGPTLLDVLIDPEEVPPMAVRSRVLASSM